MLYVFLIVLAGCLLIMGNYCDGKACSFYKKAFCKFHRGILKNIIRIVVLLLWIISVIKTFSGFMFGIRFTNNYFLKLMCVAGSIIYSIASLFVFRNVYFFRKRISQEINQLTSSDQLTSPTTKGVKL